MTFTGIREQHDQLRRHLSWGVAILVLTGASAVPALAQDAGNNGAVSVAAGIDFSNAYYFRGIIQETEGFIAQPFLEAGISLFEGDSGLQSVSVTSGLWNSLHSGPSGSKGAKTGPATLPCGTRPTTTRRWVSVLRRAGRPT
jgi:hypothetical protein